MTLSETELKTIDKLAKKDRKLELQDPETSEVPPRPGAVGPLNALRAYWMLQRLGLNTFSQAKVQAALRRNWPEAWRTNERGHWFHDKEFQSLAIIALIEGEMRKKEAANIKAVAQFAQPPSS